MRNVHTNWFAFSVRFLITYITKNRWVVWDSLTFANQLFICANPCILPTKHTNLDSGWSVQ